MIDLDLSTFEKWFVLVVAAGAWFNGYLLGSLRGRR